MVVVKILAVSFNHYDHKQLSYHRETALQGELVLAKSGRRYSAVNIGASSTTVT